MARPTRELSTSINQFYEDLAQRLPRSLAILDDHLTAAATKAEQRWAVQILWEKLLPSLIAMPAAQESLAGALKAILKDKTIDPETGTKDSLVQDAQIIPDGEAKHIQALQENTDAGPGPEHKPNS